MILFNQDIALQTFAFIPYKFTAERIYSLKVLDKQKNVSTIISSGDFEIYPNERDICYIGKLSLPFPDILYEGGSYIVSFLDEDGNELFKDNAFSTHWTPSQYNIISGNYLQLETLNNEYILL